MIRKIYAVLAIAVVTILAVPTVAQAFTISPGRYLVTIDPAASQIVAVTVSNEQDQAVTFRLGVTGVRQNPDGAPLFESGSDEAETWVTPETPTIRVGARSSGNARFIIHAPDDAQPGSHYVALAVEPVTTHQDNSITARLVSIVTLQVSGMVEERVAIQWWEPRETVANTTEWPFILKLKNMGTIEVPLTGTVTVRDWRNRELFSQSIPLGNRLLVGSERLVQPTISLPSGTRYLPGLYRVHLRAVYGRTSQEVVAITSFWYIPTWLYAVGAVLGSGVLIVIIRLLYKRNKHHAVPPSEI